MGAVAAVSTPGLSDRVMQLLEQVDYRRVDSVEDREAIYRLRYDAYLREGAIRPDFSKRLTDRFDDLENTWTFAVHIDGALASSFRIHVAMAECSEMPAMQVFPDFLKPEIEARRTIIDPTRFVADWDLARRYPELPYVTLRLGFMAAEYFEADLVLATVRGEHQAFYKRIFGYREVCPPRPYLTLIKPLSLMMLHYYTERDRAVRRYPFFRSTLFERRMLFERLSRVEQRTAA